MILNDKMTEVRHLVDAELDKQMPPPNGLERRVIDAMRYASINAGKAFRPFLVVTIGDMLGVPRTTSIRIATALEMVHTFSLIHDDLPALDNDNTRRGKPACHIQFDEATAILAGDGLSTTAFFILSDPATHPNAEIRCALVHELGKSTNGMIKGEMLDIIGERTPLTLEQTEHMQIMKTGCLLRYACISSAIAAQAPESTIQALETYAHCIGLMFQITDDILDIEGSPELMGKTLGKDKRVQKSTFVSLMGIESARQKAQDLLNQALNALTIFGEEANLLRDAANFIMQRNH